VGKLLTSTITETRVEERWFTVTAWGTDTVTVEIIPATPILALAVAIAIASVAALLLPGRH